MKKAFSVMSVVFLSIILAACNEITHEVRFESNGGTNVETLVIGTTADFSMPTNPMREGFYFGGWYYDNATFNEPFTITSFLSAPLSQDLVLYAKWNTQPNIPIGSLAVNFVSDREIVESLYVSKGSFISPIQLSKKGYVLEGWYLSNDQGLTLNGKYNFLNNSINSNLTFYAYWIDVEPPVLTLVGSNVIVINQNERFVDPGIICTDTSGEGCLTNTDGRVDTSVAGTYSITYTAVDQAGNSAIPLTRVVIVNPARSSADLEKQNNGIEDTIAPIITLNGSQRVELEIGDTYNDSGAICSDNVDSSCRVVATGNVDTSVAGTYSIIYTAVDQAGNSAIPLTRVVIVNPANENTTASTKTDSEPPKLILYAPAKMELGLNDIYVEFGVGYSDNNDGNCGFVPEAINGMNVDSNCPVVISGRVDTSKPGTYILRYNATDRSGNKATELQREVTIYQHLGSLRISEKADIDSIFLHEGKLMYYEENGQRIPVELVNADNNIVTNYPDKIVQIRKVGSYLFIQSDFPVGINRIYNPDPMWVIGSMDPRIYVVDFNSNERIITQLNDKDFFTSMYLYDRIFQVMPGSTGYEYYNTIYYMGRLPYYSNSNEVFITGYALREGTIDQTIRIFTNEAGAADIELFLDYEDLPKVNPRHVFLDYDNGHAILLIENIWYIYEPSTGIVKLDQQITLPGRINDRHFKGLDGKLLYTEDSNLDIYGAYSVGNVLVYYYDEAGKRNEYSLSSDFISSPDTSNLPLWYLEALYKSIKTEYEKQGPSKFENKMDSFVNSSSISNYLKTEVLELFIGYLETGEGLTELIELSNRLNTSKSNYNDLISWELFSYNLLLDYRNKLYSIKSSVNQKYFSFLRFGGTNYRYLLINNNEYYISTGDRPLQARLDGDNITFSLMNPNVLDYSHISSFNNYIVGYRDGSIQVIDFDNLQSDPIKDEFIGDDFVSINEIRIKPNGVVVVVGADFSLNVIEVEYSLLTDLL